MNYKKGRPGLDLSGSFIALLCRWRGSLYKLCIKELIAFLVPFILVSVVYRQALNDDHKKLFEQLVRYCDKYLSMIPLSFILGFYVTIIATRWWQQCMALPWPDRLTLAICMYIPGNDIQSRVLRKTLCQNCNLMAVLVFRSISDSVRSRLKTLEDVVSAGFMTQTELDYYNSIEADINIYWLPGIWFAHHLREAKLQGKITDPHGAQVIMTELLEFRSKCGILWSYDWVSIPLVYTQVVTLATYSYLVACIMGRQHIDGGDKDGKDILPVDIYFPIWTLLQILFYMGLLKVAEHMINPYGEDDEDFDLNYLLNRHKEMIHLGSDVVSRDRCPPLEEDLLTQTASTAKPLDSRKKSSVKRRLSQTLTALYLPHKDHKQRQTIPTVSANVMEMNPVRRSDRRAVPNDVIPGNNKNPFDDEEQTSPEVRTRPRMWSWSGNKTVTSPSAPTV